MSTVSTTHEGATVACEGASLEYTDGTRRTFALQEVTVALPPGKFYGIMGPSGSGKSSLLYILSGLKAPTQGAARFGDFVYSKNTSQAITRLRRERFGFVFQQPFLLPYLNALDNIIVAAPRQDTAARKKAQALLEELGMGDLSSKLPSQLSGGEKQRVSVVRSMMNDPDIIFADEPTAALDQTNGHKVIDALGRWRTRGTVVVVTHDAGMVAEADEILHLRDGRLVDIRPPDEVAGH